MKNTNNLAALLLSILLLLIMAGCGSNTNNNIKNATDSLSVKKDTAAASSKQGDKDTSTKTATQGTGQTVAVAEKPVVLIYNFHITNRCVSCIAIEEATTKTLNTYFASEVKQARIKRQILNVDDKANKFISEKYEAFGSGLFITRSFKGKETTADFTGTGFKYAKNKEDKFIELLKKQIEDYLK